VFGFMVRIRTFSVQMALCTPEFYWTELTIFSIIELTFELVTFPVIMRPNRTSSRWNCR
jgi:hypothetical protein